MLFGSALAFTGFFTLCYVLCSLALASCFSLSLSFVRMDDIVYWHTGQSGTKFESFVSLSLVELFIIVALRLRGTPVIYLLLYICI